MSDFEILQNFSYIINLFKLLERTPPHAVPVNVKLVDDLRGPPLSFRGPVPPSYVEQRRLGVGNHGTIDAGKLHFTVHFEIGTLGAIQ